MFENKAKKSFEEALSRLDEIVDAIGDEKTSVTESVRLYSEGVELALYCGSELGRAETEVLTIKEKLGGGVEFNKFV